MAAKTGIAWTDSTWNPWIGCTKVGPGCDHCYAEALMDKRWHKVQWGAGQERQRTSAANWRQPLLWERGWEDFQTLYGRRRRVFCASLADVFDNAVPREWRYDLLWLISNTPHLDWLLLTKRIGNATRMLAEECARMAFPWSAQRWPNVWLGITVVNQEEADRDIPKLLSTPAAVRFLSLEPMLGPIDLRRIVLHSGPIDLAKTAPPEWRSVKTVNIVMDATRPGKKSSSYAIDWVIAGGESGHGARPAHPDWFRSLRDQCAAAGVPFFFKQWGEWAPMECLPGGDLGGQMRDGKAVIVHAPGNPEGFFRRGDAMVGRFGIKAAGSLLDGAEVKQWPPAAGRRSGAVAGWSAGERSEWKP